MSRRPSAAERGTAADALRVVPFRRLYVGTLLSNTGRWMQTAALGVLAWEISESSAYLGMVIFAQLGPMGILSLIGGSLADTADRRKLLLGCQLWQMIFTVVLAAMVVDDTISRQALLLMVFLIGLGQGLYAPTLTSVIPSIAGERNLSAAIALNSMQVNLSRVVGPAIGGWLVARYGFAEVFFINAASYVFVLAAIFFTTIAPGVALARSFRERVFGGFTVAGRAPQVGRPLLLMALFALLCLPFLGQLPAIAEVNLGVDAQSTTYGWFYATFGLGALIGAALVGTVFLRVTARRSVPVVLVGFAVSLAWLATVRDVRTGYLAIFCVGLFYFALPTSLSTAWQEHVDSTVRGRVAALWTLAFGGTVPIANVIAGQIVELSSLTVVLLTGAAAALALAFIPLVSGPIVGEEIFDQPSELTGRSRS